MLAYEIEEIFLNEKLSVFSDAQHSQVEERHIAFGQTKVNRLLAVAFTLREKDGLVFLRPISARPMHKKEKLVYEKTIEEIKKP